MKIIVSHDVDHLRAKEHLLDRYWPGMLVKSLCALAQQEDARITRRFRLRLENLQDLRAYNRANGISETYFFATRKGLSLSYSHKAVGPFASWLRREGVEIGLHGQSPDSLQALMEEKERLSAVGAGVPRGIRNHYLRKTSRSLGIMGAAGFTYDSTYMQLTRPFKQDGIWEIPISIMDVTVLSPTYNDSVKVWDRTLHIIHEAEKRRIPYFVINFHDVYFCDGWRNHRDWYERLIQFFSDGRYPFSGFLAAVDELEGQSGAA